MGYFKKVYPENSTSAWKGGGKNTHGHSEETEVRILMINLLRWSFKVKLIVMYAFGSWGRKSSAWGGVEHTGNGTTMETLGARL